MKNGLGDRTWNRFRNGFRNETGNRIDLEELEQKQNWEWNQEWKSGINFEAELEMDWRIELEMEIVNGFVLGVGNEIMRIRFIQKQNQKWNWKWNQNWTWEWNMAQIWEQNGKGNRETDQGRIHIFYVVKIPL